MSGQEASTSASDLRLQGGRNTPAAIRDHDEGEGGGAKGASSNPPARQAEPAESRPGGCTIGRSMAAFLDPDLEGLEIGFGLGHGWYTSRLRIQGLFCAFCL